MNIDHDNYLNTFIQNRQLQPSTNDLYKYIIQNYYKHTKQTPAMLITEARQEQIENPWMSKRKNKTILNNIP